MQIQKSFSKGYKDKGILYIVGTPIGNLDDITYRAVKILQEVDIVAAEDTRQTVKLLNHLNLKKQIVSYHEHNKESRGNELLTMLKDGTTMALVSDAGLPSISDPGYDLVSKAIEEKLTVIPIPGPNAAITGLIVSGLPTENFVFIGFLPRDKKMMLEKLNQLKTYQETLIFYESPHRISKTIQIMLEVFKNRNVALIRELTKIHEEIFRGKLIDLNDYLSENTLKGEITLVLEGKIGKEDTNEDKWWENLTILEHVDYYIEKGNVQKDAMKMVAIDRDLSKREIYKEYHHL